MTERRRFSARRVLPYVAVAIGGAVAAVAFVGFISVGRDVGPGRIELSMRFDRSADTEVAFPPLGRVRAATHETPIGIRAHVEELDIERLQDLLNDSQAEERLRSEVDADLGPLVRAYALRAILVATIAGAIVGAIVPRRRAVFIAVGACSGAATIAVLLAGTWQGYKPEAFDEPEFSGALERAPQIIDAVERHVEDLPAIRDRIDVLSAQLSRLYTIATEPPEPSDDETVRILHVSDIHSNPLALEIVDSLATRFDVAAVLDTGDLTSFGYPIESQVGGLIRRLDRPYLFVPGNHDSPENRSAIAAVPNVQLLDREIVDIEGVKILGVADPTFTATNEIDDDEAADIKEEFAPEVGEFVQRARPDVLAVHDRRIAVDAYGSVPLVVGGHYHRQEESIEDGTRVLTVGSTGATGLGSFTVEGDIAYEAEILHFSDGDLRIVDYLWLEGLSGNYRIERRLVAEDDAPENDAPEDDAPEVTENPDQDSENAVGEWSTRVRRRAFPALRLDLLADPGQRGPERHMREQPSTA